MVERGTGWCVVWVFDWKIYQVSITGQVFFSLLVECFCLYEFSFINQQELPMTTQLILIYYYL